MRNTEGETPRALSPFSTKSPRESTIFLLKSGQIIEDSFPHNARGRAEDAKKRSDGGLTGGLRFSDNKNYFFRPPSFLPWPRKAALKKTSVKQVIAVVKPYLVEKVLEALKHSPLEACEVNEVKGYGRQKSYLDEYRGSEYSLAYLPKVEITVWVDDVRADEVIRTIVDVARTGRMGDGKIFVLPTLSEFHGESLGPHGGT